jgi:hypothetical protein
MRAGSALMRARTLRANTTINIIAWVLDKNSTPSTGYRRAFRDVSGNHNGGILANRFELARAIAALSLARFNGRFATTIPLIAGVNTAAISKLPVGLMDRVVL